MSNYNTENQRKSQRIINLYYTKNPERIDNPDDIINTTKQEFSPTKQIHYDRYDSDLELTDDSQSEVDDNLSDESYCESDITDVDDNLSDESYCESDITDVDDNLSDEIAASAMISQGDELPTATEWLTLCKVHKNTMYTETERIEMMARIRALTNCFPRTFEIQRKAADEPGDCHWCAMRTTPEGGMVDQGHLSSIYPLKKREIFTPNHIDAAAQAEYDTFGDEYDTISDEYDNTDNVHDLYNIYNNGNSKSQRIIPYIAILCGIFVYTKYDFIVNIPDFNTLYKYFYEC